MCTVYNIIKPIFLQVIICLFITDVSFAQPEAASLISPKFNYHPVSFIKYGLNDLPAQYRILSLKTYVEKRNDSLVLTKYNPYPFTNYSQQKSTLNNRNDFLESFMVGYAFGYPQMTGAYNPNTTFNNSKSTFIGFTLGFISSGIIGGLFNKNHNNGGIPPFYNDFINFNRH